MTNIPVTSAGSKSFAAKNQKVSVKPVRPHCKVSIEDINWVRRQDPCVQQLWLDSIAAEQFGGAAHDLDSQLSYNSFQKAKKALADQGLFEYQETFTKPVGGRSRVAGYRVRNLHGYYNKQYWEVVKFEGQKAQEKKFNVQPLNADAQPPIAKSQVAIATSQQLKIEEPQTPAPQDFENANNVLTPSQQPTKVVGEGVMVNEHSPTAAPYGCGVGELVGEKSEVKEFSREEIFGFLDAAKVGVCPPKDAIAQILNSEFAPNLRGFIKNRPEWGINIADFIPQITTGISSIDRVQFLNRLKNFAKFGQTPPTDFLRQCWDDLILRFSVKKFFGHLVPEEWTENGAVRISLPCAT